jgi:BASS family bile acid:Na+ symporter
MDVAHVIPFAMQASIFLVVFSVGLTATIEDLLYLLHRPGLAFRSFLSMNIAMALVAGLLAAAFDLHQAVKVALITLGMSPVPPLLPRKQVKAGGRGSYAIGLFVTAALSAIVFVPIEVPLIGQIFGKPVHMPPSAVARIVLVSVLLPLVLGVLVRRLAPDLSERAAKPIGSVAMALLILVALLILLSTWRPAVSLIGSGTLVAAMAFVVVGLGVGHLLGGPEPRDRTVLALSTACRHPGVAMAIASANFPAQTLELPAMLLYILVSVLLSIPYLAWRKRQAAAGTIHT